jgi:hypothetical protein
MKKSMELAESLQSIATSVGGVITEKNGVYTLEALIAERKTFLSRKKLTYIAKFRVDEEQKEIKFTEMLKESGFGLSSGMGNDDMSPGFGFKTESYNTLSGGPREGTIEEQSNLFGKNYQYKFEWGVVRKALESLASEKGWAFKYQVTPIGL